MFPRTHRLSRTTVALVLKTGRRVSAPTISAVYSSDSAGYAVVIPKKVARLSVTRHHIKRRVLEALRTLPTLPPSLILFPKAAAAHMTNADLSKELSTLLSKIRR